MSLHLKEFIPIKFVISCKNGKEKYSNGKTRLLPPYLFKRAGEKHRRGRGK